MTKTVTIAGSVVLATAIGVGLFLRPRSTAVERLAEPASIPAIARQALRAKMARHEVQMRTLVSRVVMLDDDGIARAAGEIFDEPALAVRNVVVTRDHPGSTNEEISSTGERS